MASQIAGSGWCCTGNCCARAINTRSVRHLTTHARTFIALISLVSFVPLVALVACIAAIASSLAYMKWQAPEWALLPAPSFRHAVRSCS